MVHCISNGITLFLIAGDDSLMLVIMPFVFDHNYSINILDFTSLSPIPNVVLELLLILSRDFTSTTRFYKVFSIWDFMSIIHIIAKFR